MAIIGTDNFTFVGKAFLRKAFAGLYITNAGRLRHVRPVSFDQGGDPQPAAVAIDRMDPTLESNPRRLIQGLRLVGVVEPSAALAK